MKKYLLTALLGVFGLFTAFASADTVGNFTSDSSISSINLEESSNVSVESMLEIDENIRNFYICISSSDIPYYYQYDDGNGTNPLVLVSSSNYCSSTQFEFGDSTIYFYSNSELDYKYLNGTLYFSSSPITYSSSEGGDSGDSLLPGGTTAFSGIITSLGSAVSEFIPYVAYIGIGLLGAIIGFVAIKRLINRVRAKIFGTFSGGRRR